MRMTRFFGALMAAALLVPAGASAQERHAERARGWMGIGFEWEDDNPREAVVGQVVPGSAAEQAGVRRGDVVVRIDGQAATEEAVDRLRDRLAPGDTVRLRLRRDGRELDQRVIASERRAGPVVMRRRGDGEDITIEVPSEHIRMRLDTMRMNVERLLTRVDSLHGRLELLNGDTDGVVLRMERRPGEPMRIQRGRVRILGRDSAGRRIEMDSVIVLHDSLMRHLDGLPGRVRVFRRDSAGMMEFDSVIVLRDSVLAHYRELPRARVEAFPYRDADPGVPFYMEMGRRGVAGAELVEMNPGLARYFHTEHGLLVAQVSPESPMARAGVEAGDVIVRAGGARVNDVAELRAAFESSRREAKLSLEVVRQGNRRTLEMQWEPVQWRVRSETSRPRRARTN